MRNDTVQERFVNQDERKIFMTSSWLRRPRFLWAVFAVLAMLVPVVYADEVALEGPDGNIHKVLKGDTLWEIAETYLEDPYQWPKLWWYNGQVINPDLIYPGGKIRIPVDLLKPHLRVQYVEAELPADETIEPIDEGPEEPREYTDLDENAIETEALPEMEMAEAEIAPLVIEVEVAEGVINPLMVEAGGYLTKDINAVGEVRGNYDKRWFMAEGDTIFLKVDRKQEATPGTLFQVVRPSGKVRHPRTHLSMGELVWVVGMVRVEGRYGKMIQAHVDRSFAEIISGDKLIPYVRPGVSVSVDAPKLNGYVVATDLGRMLSGTGDVIFLDRGRKHGLSPGQELHVLREGGKTKDGLFGGYELPDREIAVIQVLSVRNKNATARIISSSDAVSRGDTWVTVVQTLSLF